MVSLRVPDGGSVDQRDALGMQPRNSASKVPEQILAIKDLVDKREKIRGRRLRYEQMRGSNQTMGLTKSIHFGSNKNESGHRYEMEITRQERSKKDAEDDLKMRNIKSLLKKLLNKKGLG